MLNPIDDSTGNRIEKMIEQALEEGRTRMHEPEAYRILELIGVPSPANIFVTSPKEIPSDRPSWLSGGRVICKLISQGMPHRTEYGGVRVVSPGGNTLEKVFQDFSAISAEAGVKLSGMMIADFVRIEDSIPHQLLISIKQDRSFGPLVTIALGGVGTEIYRESLKDEKGIFVATPDTAGRAGRREELLDATMFYPLITGKTKISPQALLSEIKIHQIIDSFISLADRFSRESSSTGVTIEELEVNPLQLSDSGAMALDALMTVSRDKVKLSEREGTGIDSLLKPESVLLIGASAKRMNMGRIILKNLGKSKYIDPNKIYTLHRKKEIKEIEGFRTFHSLEQIPEPVGLAVFTLPAGDQSMEMISRIISEEKARSMILISGGFSETKEGRRYGEALKKTITQKRDSSPDPPVVNGPNCMGIVSNPGGYNTFFVPEYKLSFSGDIGANSAFISQSGAFIVTMMSILDDVNPSYMITVGNQVDLTVTDYLERLGDDPSLDTYFVYLEGFRILDGKGFLQAAGRILESGKKVIVYKSGRSAEGAAAAASHTAAMAGDYFIFRRLMENAGVLVADSLEDFEDYMRIFTYLSGRRPEGGRVGIISDAGYECTAAADNLHGMKLAEFSDETMIRLRENMPSKIVDIKNPLDTTPAIDTINYGRCVKSMIDDSGTDCLVVSNVASTYTQENLPPGPGHGEDISRADSHPNTISRLVSGTEKPVVVSMNGGAIYDPAVEIMEKKGVCVFRKIDRAVKALGKFVELNNKDHR